MVGCRNKCGRDAVGRTPKRDPRFIYPSDERTAAQHRRYLEAMATYQRAIAHHRWPLMAILGGIV